MQKKSFYIKAIDVTNSLRSKGETNDSLRFVKDPTACCILIADHFLSKNKLSFS